MMRHQYQSSSILSIYPKLFFDKGQLKYFVISVYFVRYLYESEVKLVIHDRYKRCVSVNSQIIDTLFTGYFLLAVHVC